eukprot:scaffold184_cov316-Pinguiococcus_pyrenoidosus.AAC.67
MERLEKGTLDSCLVVMGACDCGAGSVWAWCPNFALSKVVALEKVRRNPGLGMERPPSTRLKAAARPPTAHAPEAGKYGGDLVAHASEESCRGDHETVLAAVGSNGVFSEVAAQCQDESASRASKVSQSNAFASQRS